MKHYSLEVLEVLQKSVSQTNPAWFLYKNKARSALFMAESLTRLLDNLPENKELSKETKKIKKIEDSLGRIDDYDALYLLFSKNKKIKKKEADYFLAKREKEERKLNKKLIEKDFYQQTFHSLAVTPLIHFHDKILIKKLHRQINKELRGCFNFYLKYPEAFTSMEKQVHALRRKLRWLSIYAQSFDGIIVLDPDKTKYEWEKRFITAAEIKSPYNKIPVTKKLEAYIHFNKKAFLALSYMVAALGKIKDKGLQMEELAKSICKTTGCSKQQARKLTVDQLNLKYSEEDLFKEAHTLLHAFFIKYRIHELLLKK